MKFAVLPTILEMMQKLHLPCCPQFQEYGKIKSIYHADHFPPVLKPIVPSLIYRDSTLGQYLPYL